MSSVDRIGWQDTQKVNFCKEVYNKEERIRHSFLDVWEEEAREAAAREGRPYQELDPEHDLSQSPNGKGKLAENQPKFERRKFASEAEVEEHLRSQLSKNLWKRMNAGYVEHRTPIQSMKKSTYVYNADELEPVSKEFFRKRDGFTNYVEASARYKLLMKKKQNEK